MNSDTNIPDREVFDRQFSEYYGSEKFTTLALATGIMGNLGFRVLTSLDEPGTENEIGLYKGTIYQYTGGKWLAVGLEGYMGVKNELPNASLNQYFMVGETFLVLQQLIVNDEKLLVNDDQELFVNQEFQEGFIYVKEGDYWKKVSDTTDYRYVVAMIDLVTITGQLPGVFQEAIDKATENLLDHLPAYLGPKTAFPQTALEGDFFVYSGPTYGSHIQSDVYRWEQGQWVHLDPKDSVNGDIYMRCLDDILSINNAGSASFASVFANAFWAHSITTEKLSTRTLYLKEGGYIQSYNTYWDYHHSGLRIDSNGDIDANGDTHIGGTCSIDGTASIGGNTTIGGTCKITGNTTVSGNVDINGKGTIGNDMTVTGNIDTDGSLTVKGTTNISGNTTIGGNININGQGTIGDSVTVTGLVQTRGLNIVGFTPGTAYSLGSTRVFIESLVKEPGKYWVSAGKGKLRINYNYATRGNSSGYINVNNTRVWTGSGTSTTGYIDVNVDVDTVIYCSVDDWNRVADTILSISLTVNEENGLLRYLSKWVSSE